MRFKPYPKYKPSGVEWLGDVPETWDVKSLKREFSVIGGSTPKSDNENYWDGSIVWVTPADLSKLSGFEIDDSQRKITEAGLDSCGTSLVPSGSIVFSTRAPIGSLAIAKEELCTNQGCKSLVPKAHVHSRYVAYILSVATNELNIRGKGTTFLELSGDELGAFKVPLPNTADQSAIATFLDRETAKIDTLIAKQEKLIELLKEKRQAIISHAVTKGLNPNVKMKDSGIEWLGEVPEHWEVVRLKRVTSVIIDGAHFTPTYVDEGIPFLRVTDIQSEFIDMDSLKKIPLPEHVELIKRCNPRRGDILLSKNGTIGLTKIVNWDFEFSIFVSLCLIRPDPVISAIYLERVLSSDCAFEQFKDSSKQTSVSNLHLEKIREIIITLPSFEEQAAIVEYLDTETGKIDALVSKAQHAIELQREHRTALISAAVTGKIDVLEAA